jgi:hypothetical protein
MSGQLGATGESTVAFNLARQMISHFVQTLNLAIDRHTFPPAARGFYQLDGNQAKLPTLTSEEDVMTWGDRLKEGEPARVAAGGAPITFPSIAEVNTAFDDFVAKRQTQDGVGDLQDNKEEAVAALRPSVDLLIKDMWDETEFKFRHQSPSSMRGKARGWGVVYISRPGEVGDALPGQAEVLLDAVGTGTYTVTISATGTEVVFDVFEKLLSAPDFTQVGTDVPAGPFTRSGLPAGGYEIKATPKNEVGEGPESESLGLTVS